jgi:phosphatidylserine synthase
MNKTGEPQKQFMLALCVWLCILMVGYTLLHMLYTIVSFPTPPILYFLPAFIYIVGGLLLVRWCVKTLRKSTRPVFSGALIVLVVSLALLLLGAVFGEIGLQHLLLNKGIFCSICY